MVLAVLERDLDVDDGIALAAAALGRGTGAGSRPRDVLARDVAALDRVLEHDALAGRGLELEHDLGELAAAARLLGVLVIDLGVAADGLAERDARLADVRLHAVVAHDAVPDDLEVELAHPVDDQLLGLAVDRVAERRVLARELLQHLAELLLVLGRLRSRSPSR